MSARPAARGRRELAARGAMINAGFQIGIGGLNLLKAVIAAAFLTAAEFGVWSVVLVAVIFVGVMRMAAVGDKYIQQDEPDQELAFQKAFTLELLSGSATCVLAMLIAPVLALGYGQEELLLPALVLALVLPGQSLLAPSWVFYRRMDFLRQRLITAVDPVVAFVVTVALAASGAGYWSLIVGLVAGAWCAGLVALALSPYPVRFVYDPGTMRQYLRFSWPLVLAAGGGALIAAYSLLLGNLALGLAGAGAIGLASNFSFYTDSIDRIITSTIYPAVCRVRDQRDLLLETFTKTNRLTLMWGMPFGIGLALFAGDLVEFGLGEQWSHATTLIAIFGATAAVNHVGFNWGAFYRATGQTRPIAVVTITTLAVLVITATPLIFIAGLDGYGIAVVAMTATSLALRFHYLLRLFPRFAVFAHTLRAVAPTVPAAAAVLLARLAQSGERSLGIALAEAGLYLALTAVLTLAFEGPLLREALRYLRRRGDPAAAGAG